MALTRTDAPDGHVVVISGCSGGGKSTLVRAMAERGHTVIPEAGRQIVQEQQTSGGSAIPWVDISAFAALTFERSVKNTLAAPTDRLCFSDRSPLDTIAALTALNRPIPDMPWLPLHQAVFIAPPWPEIFTNDAERKHTLQDALGEYRALCPIYEAAGHTCIMLPKSPVADRVAFVESWLGLPKSDD